MRRIISVALFLPLILLGITLSGCGGTTATPTPSIVRLSISPSPVSLSAGETQQFIATVTGTSQTAVVWSVTGCTGTACGTISATGLYTAPSNIPNTGTATVLATLNSDPTKSATANVTHVPPGEAQGVYSGTSYIGISGTFYSIVLPNEMYYAFYPDFWGEGGFSNMMVGKGRSVNGTYTANLTNFVEGNLVPLTLTATYIPGVSMTGSVTVVANGYTTTFNANALPSSLFEWDTPANLSHIMGTWPGPVTVDSNGAFTGSYGVCPFTGTITPSPTNKNFFNVTITYGDSPCYLANQTGSGIAIETLLPDGITRQLLAGGPVGQWIFIIEASR